MSRTLTPAQGIAAAAEASTFCHIAEIERRNKSTLYITNTDKDIVVDGNTYRSARGFTLTQISLSLFTTQQNTELSVALHASGVTVDDIEAGEFDDQLVTVSIVDWNNLGDGGLVLFAGTIGDCTFDTAGFATFDLNGLMSKRRALANELFSPTCRNELGDDLCGFAINSTRFLATVDGSPTPTQYSFSTNATAVDDYYSAGVLEWVTGNNAGLFFDIKGYTQSQGLVKIWTKLPRTIQVGDTCYLYQGCPKTVAACRDTFDNLLNFRGEPYMPPEDVIPSKPDPKPRPHGDKPRKRPCTYPYPTDLIRR